MPWIFGYGSLIWRPGFNYSDRKCGYISGWTRRLWQGSEDHRGVPGNPGRVVTLIPTNELPKEEELKNDGARNRTYGVAYWVEQSQMESVTTYLDVRECGGYSSFQSRMTILNENTTNGKVEDSIPVLVYIATTDNANYLGPAEYPEMADQIRRCHGPSGSNIEYFEKLLLEHRKLFPSIRDGHLELLEQHLINNN